METELTLDGFEYPPRFKHHRRESLPTAHQTPFENKIEEQWIVGSNFRQDLCLAVRQEGWLTNRRSENNGMTPGNG